jgi:hypothetical protein
MEPDSLDEDESLGRFRTANVEVHGALMQCEYVCNERGLFSVMMLADVEIGRGTKGRWKQTLADASLFAFEQIEPSRRLSILVSQGQSPFVRRAFRQMLKRDLMGERREGTVYEQTEAALPSTRSQQMTLDTVMARWRALVVTAGH